jgi:hypothetical protein
LFHYLLFCYFVFILQAKEDGEKGKEGFVGATKNGITQGCWAAFCYSFICPGCCGGGKYKPKKR